MKQHGLPKFAEFFISFFTSAEDRAKVISDIEKEYEDLREKVGIFAAAKFLAQKLTQIAACAIFFHIRIDFVIALALIALRALSRFLL